MAVGAEEEEGDALLRMSQEQKVKRQRAGQVQEVGKVKVYSMLATIVILFCLLIATNLRDWKTFKAYESNEAEAVGGVAKIEEVLTPKEVTREWINEEQVLQEIERKEEERLEAAEKQQREKLENRKKKKEDTRDQIRDKIAEKDQKSQDKEKGKEKEKGKGKAKAKEEKNEATENNLKHRNYENCKPKPPALVLKRKKAMEEAQAKLAKMPKSTPTEMRAYDLFRIAAGKIERDWRQSLCLMGKPEDTSETARSKKYKHIAEGHKKALNSRDIVLSDEIQSIVDNYDGSLKPPDYCYTSPKGNKAFPKEPMYKQKKSKSKNKSNDVGEVQENEVKELSLNVSREILEIVSDDFKCLILHQDCMDENYNDQAKKYLNAYTKRYFKNSNLSPEEQLNRLPDFKKLRLGSCAVVGNADNMIKGKFGKEIDEHDFVIRYNVITKPYQEAVGSKTDGLLDKINYIGTPFAPDVKPSKFNLFPKYIPNELDRRKLPGKKPPLIYGSLQLSTWRKDVTRAVDLFKKAKHIDVKIKAYGQIKLQHPSGGIARVRALVELLKLGVCDRLDMYGFSSGGGKYFIKRMKVSRAHPISAENYIYRLWMNTGVHGKLCMYGE